MKDVEFLKWIHARLMHGYNENGNADFMHKLRAIIDGYDDVNKDTPNMPSNPNKYD